MVISNLTIIRWHDLGMNMSEGRIKRVVLWAVLCMIAASSCSRQSRSPSPQVPASSSNTQTQNVPQQNPSTSQARAVLFSTPGRAEQPDAAGAQQPDRVLASGHTSAVTVVAFSPDRQSVATGSEDKTIRIWDLATGTEQRVLSGHTDRVTSLAFSPDGQQLASTSFDGTVRLWDPANGASLYTSNLGSGSAEQVAYSADGRLFAASAGAADEGGNSIIEIHDANNGSKIRSISLAWNNAVPLAITPDDRLLSSGAAGEDGEYQSTKIWNLRTVSELKNFPVLVQAFSADGHWGASVEYREGPKINLWDITNGRRVRTIAVTLSNLSHVAFTPDGARILAISENDREIKFYESATGKEVQTLPISASAVAFSGDGKLLAASSGSSVKIWDLSAGRELQTLAGQLGAQDLAFSPDNKLLVSGDADLGLWDVASGKLIRIIPGGTQSLAYSSDGHWLATNPKGSLQIWDTRTWTTAGLFPPAGEHIWWMDFAATEPSPTNLSASGVKWWKVGADQEARSLWGATYAAAFSPNGKYLATGAARGGNVSVWDTTTGQLLRTFAAHGVGVSIVSFSPDNKWLLTAGQDSRIDPTNMGASMANLKHSVRLWKTGTWQSQLSLAFIGTTGGFGRFSPDGGMFTVSTGNLITLYSVMDGRPIKTLAGAGRGAVRFSPDGLWLAQGGPDGIALWNLSIPVK
jgi:WD40 repeat protein